MDDGEGLHMKYCQLSFKGEKWNPKGVDSTVIRFVQMLAGGVEVSSNQGRN